ncbi:MAG TPA: phosphatidylserine decarboxylase family protein [Bacteroidales bacterium]|nr:phosphatidylserine decarboxylase family protein [Bacteroidales bacterium]
MTIHKEGTYFLLSVFFLLSIIILASYFLFKPSGHWMVIISLAAVLIFVFFLRFFRKPDRPFTLLKNQVVSAADGTVVVVEETTEDEYFHDRRIQVSVFMSVWNVHINWFPVSGNIVYYRYHPGDYIVAKYPKSSLKNERNTIVIRQDDGTEILVRQIAGFVARKISCYCREGDEVTQGEELGFIKFGSRVDVFLPLNAKIKVVPGNKAKGKISILAELENKNI